MRVLIFLGVLGITAGLSVSASAVITDDFESYADQAALRDAWLDPVTFPGTNNASSLVYLNTDPTFALSGTQSAQLNRNNNNAVRDLSSEVSGMTPLIVEASVMLQQDGDGSSANLAFQVGSDLLSTETRQAHVGLVGIGGNFAVRDDGDIQTIAGLTVQADTWYKITVIMKPNTDEASVGGTYDVLIDDVLVYEDALFWHDKHRLSSSVRIAQSSSVSNDEPMFIDDFRAELVPEPASLALVGLGLGLFVTARKSRDSVSRS